MLIVISKFYSSFYIIILQIATIFIFIKFVSLLFDLHYAILFYCNYVFTCYNL
jgi:hypothetical protein